MNMAGKRLCAGFLAVMLVFGLLSSTAYADDTNTSQAQSATSALAIGSQALNAQELVIYRQLKAAIQQVASGTIATTVFTVHPAGSSITYNGITNTLSGIAPKRILEALLVDCPYELYWFDKSSTGGMGVSLDTNGHGVVTELRFGFSVAADYAGSSAYTTNASKVQTAIRAAAEARALVARTTGTDYEKLQAYMEYICNAVTYNAAAVSSNYSGSYGDPWQLVYVFDNDSTTNVVCEGYAKAFQYLCDLTDFTDAVCYTVTGTVYGQGRSGVHMWNIVTMGDGNSYLVDLTNSDLCNDGAGEFLFLVGTTPNKDGTYTFPGPICAVTYSYDTDTTDLYGTEAARILTLATTNYSASPDAG
jgi:hypothetical protein